MSPWRGWGRSEPPADEAADAAPEEDAAPQMRHGALERTMPRPDDEADEKRAALGYRTSRRSSKTGKAARKQAKTERVKADVSEGAAHAVGALVHGLKMALAVLVSLAMVVGVLWGGAIGINAFVRWNAKRLAKQAGANLLAGEGKDNLLVVGADGDRAVGFLAMKADRKDGRVLGIVIADGAFVTVPGRGFERIGASYEAGPDVSKDAVSNFLFVPFRRYVTVDAQYYQELVKSQNVGSLLDRAIATDLKSSEKADLSRFLKEVSAKDVWFVPLPVKPIAVGDQRYYEPRRDEIADLLLQWWNVRVDEQPNAMRVIIFNGVGTPGVAGKAAQQLIHAGFQVVDTRNADRFDYKTTQILLFHGTVSDAERLRTVLGTGAIRTQADVQDIADIFVIIGSDYVPSTGGG